MQEVGLQLWELLKPWVANVAAALLLVLIGKLVALAHTWAGTIHDDRVRAIVSSLVEAAEQKADLVTGPQKFDWVQAKLAERGIAADADDIEAAVYWISAALKGTAKEATDGAA